MIQLVLRRLLLESMKTFLALLTPLMSGIMCVMRWPAMKVVHGGWTDGYPQHLKEMWPTNLLSMWAMVKFWLWVFAVWMNTLYVLRFLVARVQIILIMLIRFHVQET